MKSLLNNREEELEGDSISDGEMLHVKRFTFKMRIIKINGVFIPKEVYNTTMVHNGDNVQMLYLMSGG